MLIPLLGTLGAWIFLANRGFHWKIGSLLIGFLLAGTILSSATWNIAYTQPLDSDRTLEIYYPTAFPFTVHRIVTDDSEGRHIAVAHEVVLGWPNGISIFHIESSDYQSEFNTEQKIRCALALIMTWLFLTIPFILSLELYRYFKQEKK